jgi:hypothetical protein
MFYFHVLIMQILISTKKQKKTKQNKTKKHVVSAGRFATRAVSDGANYPIDREGTVFWGVGSTNIYFAGGVNTLHPTASDFTAFTDIYTYDTGTPRHRNTFCCLFFLSFAGSHYSTTTTNGVVYLLRARAANNKFIKAEVSLPGPSYFGAGGFIQGSLVIFSGRTNTQPTYVVRFTEHVPCCSRHQFDPVCLVRVSRPWTYFSDLYVVNFTNSISASPVVITCNLVAR